MMFFIQILVILFPWRFKYLVYKYLLNFNVCKDSYIGLSIVLVKTVSMGSGARIGHLNFIKGLANLSLEDGARIGNLNWVSGFPLNHPVHFVAFSERAPSLVLGRESAITNRHFIDCTDTVLIGRFSTIAGFRSQILTHGINILRSRQECAPVRIGDYCFVGSGVIFLAGAALPNFSVLGAGAVIGSEFVEEYCLYGGVPAKLIKRFSKFEQYFTRFSGFVD